MKKLSLALLPLLALSACGLVFDGTATVLREFTIKTEPKRDPICDTNPDNIACMDPGRPTSTTFAPGHYSAKLVLKQRQANITIGNKATLSFSIPRDTALPDNGEFRLTSDQVKQAFDLQGNSTTAVHDGDRVRTTESCTYQVPEEVCHWVPGDPRYGGGGYSCHTEYRTRWGRQDVEYFVRDTHKTLGVDLLTPGTSDLVAHFDGTDDLSEKIYTYQGRCW